MNESVITIAALSFLSVLNLIQKARLNDFASGFCTAVVTVLVLDLFK